MVDLRPHPGARQKAAIFCCYGYPDRLGLHRTKLRGRKSLSIALDSNVKLMRKKKPMDSRKKRTSFVGAPQTENGRSLFRKAENLPSFAFGHVYETREADRQKEKWREREEKEREKVRE